MSNSHRHKKNMNRSRNVQFILFIMVFEVTLLSSVECQDKRIIIYVPRRIKTIHHHHHHVVLMEPPVKPNTEKSSSSSSSTTDEEYQVTKDRRVQHEQEEQEHHQESMAAAGHPLSYLEQRKAANADVSIYPAVHYPRYRTFATWPNRKKRSRVVARLYTTY